MTDGELSAAGSHAARCKAIADVFVACAELLPRAGRSYDEWLREVTRRFKRAWKVIEP
jgi:hypothetical protein